jgi:hypothetical protein
MLDRHAVQALRQAGQRPRRIATNFEISVRTVWRIARKLAVPTAAERVARRARRTGRPVQTAVATFVRGWLEEELDLPPGGYIGGSGRPGPAEALHGIPAAGGDAADAPGRGTGPLEGVAGGIARFDFGDVDVRFSDGARRRVPFAAFRFNSSRFMYVTLVPNERAEALVRTLLAGCAASGGVPRITTRLLPRSLVPERHHRPAPATGELSGRGKDAAHLAGDGGAASRPPAAGAAPPHAARRGAGGLRPAGPRHGGPHRDGDLPGAPLRDADGGVRSAGDAQALSRPGAHRVYGWATQAAASALPPRGLRVVFHGAEPRKACTGLSWS